VPFALSDVRFKNQGLDSIEIQDNGSGISPANYESVALKHHTSKLATYSDIAALQTFGFRGEALASLCALSSVTITTCLAEDVPKGTKLTFEPSGKLKDTAVVAAQRGTTVSIDKLFHNLPVRRRELERNIKREWHKVITLLNQYACVLTGVKFSVSQQPTKGKRILLFSTKGNQTTRDNIINIFGAMTMTALVSLDLNLEIVPTATGPNLNPNADGASKEVRVLGHVSRPVHGEGRQTPDRQMFFVNGRPCGLPQFARTFNEVYKSYNYSQSPFIFADIRLDTNMYDVNVSPDKRSILLHDQNHLLDRLRSALVELFDGHDYTVPLGSLPGSATLATPARPLVQRASSAMRSGSKTPIPDRKSASGDESSQDREASDEESDDNDSRALPGSSTRSRVHTYQSQPLISRWADSKSNATPNTPSQPSSARNEVASSSITAKFNRGSTDTAQSLRLRDFNNRLAEQMQGVESEHVSEEVAESEDDLEESTSPVKQVVQGPQIPATQPMRLENDTPQSSQRTPRKLKRPGSEEISVTIGDAVRSSPVISSSKRPRLSEIGSGDEIEDEVRREESRSERSASAASDVEISGRYASKRRQMETKLPQSEPGDSDEELLDEDGPEAEIEEEEEEGSEDEKASVGQDADISSPDDKEHREPNVEYQEQESLESGLSADAKKANIFHLASRRKEATMNCVQQLLVDAALLQAHIDLYGSNATTQPDRAENVNSVEDITAVDAESRLQLIISKEDFGRMRVAGQFNMGFIIAVRPSQRAQGDSRAADDDELFIIDQHASDEKYNFERLQSTTVVQTQRLVHPKALQLTALEEEIVMENLPAIEANGFKIHVDTSGDSPVGARCVLTALPLSRETAFSLEDLEELIAMLGDSPSDSSTHIPRPAKVRKMFAMRACRSSVMIGKALTSSQMYTLVRHMGELDKPWNCPHGRPTMRHLCRLRAWDEQGWKADRDAGSIAAWKSYAQHS
jgi:DNA mismatch repair protein PMS2